MSRRDLLTSAVSVAAAAGLSLGAGEARAEVAGPALSKPQGETEPFWGAHQAGIVTFPIQHHTLFATFDLTTTKRSDVADLLQAWTAAAARMTAGEPAQPLGSGLTLAVKPAAAAPEDDGYAPDFSAMSSDSGEAIGMSPSRLTLNFGFGADLFVKDGKDRYGLASRRPAAFVDLPKFVGDQMIEARTGGDLSVQACAEDPQVAFHAVRQLARIAEGVARFRWMQSGFRPTTGERHLLGFSNGKGNPPMTDAKLMDKVIWVGDEGPDWMRGGTYLVVRRIRFAIEHWDHMPTEYQEKAIGEVKYSHGKANADGREESPPEDDGESSHLRIVTPDAFTMVRRSYSYNNGLSFVSERWPPWRQGIEYDAGMLFICYQRDPRTGFINMYDKMAKYDAKLNQFWTHEGSGLFACPGGARDGEFVGQRLFRTA
ncbi:MAG: Dyp-type peroxidase [Telmatospirillum sp.]|nr:Dyp-type peroxidase [Telmatospirillum sp.]